MTEAVIVSTARTPIGKAHRGAFNQVRGADMAAHAIRHAMARAKLEPEAVEEVVMGCGYPEAANGPERRAPCRAGRRDSGAVGRRHGQPLLRLRAGGDRPCGAAGRDGRRAGRGRRRCRVDQPRAAGYEARSRHERLADRQQAIDLHDDDRDGRQCRAALRYLARGAGRLFAGKPAPHRRGAAAQALR